MVPELPEHQIQSGLSGTYSMLSGAQTSTRALLPHLIPIQNIFDLSDQPVDTHSARALLPYICRGALLGICIPLEQFVSRISLRLIFLTFKFVD
jgi:hypothetical protein